MRSIAYDPYNFEALKAILSDRGMPEDEIEALFFRVTQGPDGMGPHIGELQAQLLDGNIRHGGHPVLEWNAKNAILIRGRVSDKYMLAKPKNQDHKRIDGMVALAMAAGRRAMMIAEEPQFVDAGMLIAV